MRPIILKMKAFGSYGSETTIDFSKTTQNLFLITGDTGAGKTTIFDAIVFALYGQTGSLYNKKEGVLLQSHFTSYESTPEVTFRFAKSAQEGASEYTVKRIPKHLRPAKRRGSSGKDIIEEKGSVELILPDGSTYAERNVDEKIEEIVGLTKEQFMQVAMIAQGEFMELLRAKTDDKKEIFRKLFNTELYEKIRRILEDRKKAKEKEIAIIKTTCRSEISHVTITDDFEKYEKIQELSDNINNEKLTCLGDYLVLLEEFCKQSMERLSLLTTERDEVKKTLDTTQSDYAKAKTLMSAFAEYEQAQTILKECEALEKEMQEKDRLAVLLGEAYEVQPVYQLYQEAVRDLSDMKQKLSDKEEILPTLEEKCIHAANTFEEVSVRYEKEKKTLHEISQKAEEAVRLFDRRDKAELDKKEKTAKCLSAEKEKKKLETQLADIKEKQDQCAEDLKGYNDAYADKVNAENALQKSVSLGESIEALCNIQKEMEAQNTKLLKSQKEFQKAEAKYHERRDYYESVNSLFLNEQAGILASALVEGEPCKVCGSRVHPAPYRLPEDFQVPTQRDVESASKESEDWNQKQQKKSLEASELKITLENKNSQYEAECRKICAELGIQEGGTDVILNAYETYKNEAEQKFQLRKERLDFLEQQKLEQEKCSKSIEKLQKKLEDANTKITEFRQELSGLEAALTELANNTEFATSEEADSAKKQAEDNFAIIKKEYESKDKANKKANSEKEKALSLIEDYKNTIPSKQKRTEQQKAAYESLLQQKSA
ncbi:MAG: SMC family ATPase, partial [Lachnospiraceae bacterium]|nr:SMC family ATPase [Lachnospiraceae bacterium]